jgi:predicted AlkP superfamily pyrophosphatase or phosphodiesterase
LSAFLRHVAAGIVAGFFATAFVLVVLPHFYSHPYELLYLSAVGALAGVLWGAVASIVRAAGHRRAAGPNGRSAFGRRFAVVGVVSVVLALAMYAARIPARAWKVSPQLLALCIDGGTWRLIDPLIEDGRMPNMERLKSEGTAAILLSEEPMYSLVAWTTIGSGVHPAKHGIQTFYDTQDNLRCKRIWEVFDDHDRTIGLFRWWITWPPRVKNGFVIPGILARDATTIPPEYSFINQFRVDMKSGRGRSLGRAISAGWRYLRAGLRMETCVEIARETLPAIASGRYADFHIASRRAEIRLNADVYCHLLREFQPGYTCFYDNGVDQMSHFYWQFLEPELFPGLDPADVERYGGAITDFYALHDKVIGRILQHVGDSTDVAVLSDHGFTADTGGTRNLYFPRGVTLLRDLGMDEEFFSVAIGSKTFVSSVKRDSLERRAAQESALEVFNSLTVQESGLRLFHAYIEEEGRIQLDVNESLTTLDGYVQTAHGPKPVGSWFNTRALAGTHHIEGICLVKGPGFRRGHEGETARLVDVAPTLLYVTGFPLSRELDGSVMWDWIDDGFRSERPLAYVDSYGPYEPVRRDVDVDEKTLEKLRSLGYVQ